MTTRHLIDPETLPIVEAFVPIDPMNKGVEQMRALVDAFTAQMPDPAIAPHIVMAPGLDGAPDVPLHIYTPSGGNRRRPVILHIHGGAMISGSAAMAKRYLPELTEEHYAIGVSIDYRLAPETPFPGPQQDCLAGLRGRPPCTPEPRGVQRVRRRGQAKALLPPRHAHCETL